MHGSHPTLLIACDASNAQAVTVREYHCCCCRSSLIEFPHSILRHSCLPLFLLRSHRACAVSASCSRKVIRTTYSAGHCPAPLSFSKNLSKQFLIGLGFICLYRISVLPQSIFVSALPEVLHHRRPSPLLSLSCI